MEKFVFEVGWKRNKSEIIFWKYKNDDINFFQKNDWTA